MSGVDDVNISLVGGLVGGAVFLTGAAVVLLFKGVKTAAVATGRAVERAHAVEQARKLASERAEATERSIQAMELETEKTTNRIRETGLLADKNILALHEEIGLVNQQQNERFMKQFQVYQAAFSNWQIEAKEDIEHEALIASEQITKLRNDVLHELRAQREVLEKEIIRQNREIAAEIQKNNVLVSSAADRVNSIEKTAGGHQKYAQYWIEQARGLLAGIESWPREDTNLSLASKLREDLDKVEKDMQLHAYESAITAGRRVFQDALDLKERIAIDEIERNKLYAHWQEQLTKVSEDIKDDTNLIYEMETSEGIEKIPADLDYWTNGKFSNIQKTFDELNVRFSNIEKKSAEEITKGMMVLENISAELAVLRQTGKANFIFSHNRYVQSCHFADIFSENFSMTDCEGDYEGEDQRGAYIGIYKNPVTNDTIAVKIQPIPDEAGIMNHSRLEVHYFNNSNNEEQREQWRQKINGLLGGKTLSCKSRKGLPSDQVQLTNIDWVRRQKQRQTNA
jgi:hypothetical protein